MNQHQLVEWDQVLERARQDESKEWLYEYLPQICTATALQDPVKLRILGNAVANNQKNRDFLYNSGLVSNLLQPRALELNVLMNYCIDNPHGSQQLLHEHLDKLVSTLKETTDESRVAAKYLVSVAAQEVDIEEIDIATRRKIVLDGAIEFLLVDESLEIDPEILKNFDKIYQYALASENIDDATQVIGNITCHSNFGLSLAENIEPQASPVFILVMANLTGKLADVEPTLAAFPSSIELAMKDLDQDDFFSVAHFLRNVCRIQQHAELVANHDQQFNAILEDVLESNYNEVGVQLAGLVGQYVPRFELFEVLDEMVDPDPSINAALLVAFSQLCFPLGTPLTDDQKPTAKQLDIASTKLIELLESTPALEQTANLWLKASKALALLSRHTTLPDISHLRDSAYDAPEIKANFALINN